MFCELSSHMPLEMSLVEKQQQLKTFSRKDRDYLHINKKINHVILQANDDLRTMVLEFSLFGWTL